MIHETNDAFPFPKLILCKPISNGSGFFIRYSINEQSFYIQPPKCYIKQLHAKPGKKMYVDIVFQQENEAFLRWMEHLENHTQSLLYDHRVEWFSSDLEKEDIEQSFASPVKIYKSGKEYIVRANIPVRSGKSILKIYDEDEHTVPLENIIENTKVMVILEIQGVRSSTRSFQIDMEVKQMMVMKPEEIFNTCIFKKREDSSAPVSLAKEEKIESNSEENTPEIKDPTEINDPTEIKDPIETETKFITPLHLEEPTDPLEENDLREIEFNLDELMDTEPINIKERKEMYYQMYQEARQKAKVARDLALSAYLEAKQIKNKYMLDDVIDSSSDESDMSDESDED